MALGRKLSFAQVERDDYDIVATYEQDGDVNFVPIQLKEWAPDFLPWPTALQTELDKLGKYVDSADLVVAFHLNRETRVVLSELSLPRSIGGLWFYGCTEPSQNHWTLIGDLLKEPVAYEFEHPEA